MKLSAILSIAMLALAPPVAGVTQTPAQSLDAQPAADAGSPFYLRLVEQADSALADGQWLHAASLLEQAIDSEPGNPGNILLLSNLGIARFNNGQDSMALQAFGEALRQAPSSVAILANRGRVYAAMGRDNDAAGDYSRIISLDSTYISARLHRALLSLKHRKFAAAKADVDFLATHYGATDEAIIAQATMHSSLGEYEQAIPFYNEILRTRREPEYYGARAYCRLMTGELQDAAADIAAALALDPTDGELYLYRAALNKMHYRPDDARTDARRAVQLGVDPARAKPFM